MTYANNDAATWVSIRTRVGYRVRHRVHRLRPLSEPVSIRTRVGYRVRRMSARTQNVELVVSIRTRVGYRVRRRTEATIGELAGFQSAPGLVTG